MAWSIAAFDRGVNGLSIIREEAMLEAEIVARTIGRVTTQERYASHEAIMFNNGGGRRQLLASTDEAINTLYPTSLTWFTL